jgi:CheY-like chemotaxis protein
MTVISVLVIARDGDLRRILRTLLEREGFAVAEAFDGLEGVRQFIQTQPNLVILDEWLPDLDGWRIVEQMRKRSDEVPISILGTDPDEVRGLNVGADGEVAKPSDRVNGADIYLAKPLNRVEFLVHAKALSGDRVRDAGYYRPNNEQPAS